jgi:hypothetical protein
VSAAALLLLLLVLAIVGSEWGRADGRRGFGSASGAEYLVLGVLLGPHCGGVLDDAVVGGFEPIALAALSWIALGYGMDCVVHGERSVPLGRIVSGWAITLFVGGASGLGAGWVASSFHVLEGDALVAGAAVVGLVCSETARHALRRIVPRDVARGPVATLLDDLSTADDAPVMLAMAVLIAALGTEGITIWGRPAPLWASALATVGAGALVGLLAGHLSSLSSGTSERYALMLGGVFLLSGIATSVGLSATAATFAMGFSFSLRRGVAQDLRELFARSEGAVLLPVLLLAGAMLERPTSLAQIGIVVAALSVRVVASWATGLLLAVGRPSLGAARHQVGIALRVRFDDAVGHLALGAAAASTLLGELVARPALRRVLTAADELGTGSVPPKEATP